MDIIVQDGAPVLRQRAAEVSPHDISGPSVQALVARMKAVLATQEHGVALAAPQIGDSRRIFVVAEKVFDDLKTDDRPLVYINPVIIKQSKKTETLEEACLSVIGRYGHVPRASRVTLSAQDEDGNRFTRGASGLLAQIFQHEIDHLDGILYTDKATETHPLEETREENKT